MFNKFSNPARAAVIAAYQRAKVGGARRIEPIHLLGGIAESGGPGEAALAAAGVEPDRLDTQADTSDPLDADALASLGIDLDAVRENVEKSFGQGALDASAAPARMGRLPMSASAKAALGRSLRNARRSRHRWLDTGHLLLGVLDEGDSVVRAALDRAGADVDDVRADVLRRIRAEAV